MPEQYYIRRIPSGCWGNSPVWWAVNGQGYTAYLQNAERFSEEAALRMVKEDPKKWEAFKCCEIDRRCHLVFDVQDLKRLGTDPAHEPNPWGPDCSYASKHAEQING